MSRARHPRGAALRALTPIVRRLHLQEVPRLRREAARLAAEVEHLSAANEDLSREASWADARAEMFQDAFNRIEDHRFWLTRSGDLVPLGPEGEVAHG